MDNPIAFDSALIGFNNNSATPSNVCSPNNCNITGQANNNNSNINNNGININNSNINNNNINNNNHGHENSQVNNSPKYTIPGVLHYLEYEWQKFESERQQWDFEKAEMETRIALLQGERQGQENLKNDLVRRIKMLEYCLRQERVKYYKLKYGVNPPELSSEESHITNSENNLDFNLTNNDNVPIDSEDSGMVWKSGRQLLRQYLQEIGYTDFLIDVRSSRVRTLLGLNTVTPLEKNVESNKANVSSEVKQVRRTGHPAMQVVSDAEASVLATFEFLDEQSKQSHLHDESNHEETENIEEDEEESSEDDGSGCSIDCSTKEVLAEFDFLTPHKHNFSKDSNIPCWGSATSKDIGELATLTLVSESQDVNGSTITDGTQEFLNDEMRKTWNPRFILKSHFDCVRCLRFHQTEPILVTCSEDETLKLWNLNKTQLQSNKGKQQVKSTATAFDLEPLHTYRGHTSRVLSLTLINNTIYSGAQNGELFIWSIPENTSTIDPYETCESSLSFGTLNGHTDAIWSLVSLFDTSNSFLCSAGADSTIKIWNINNNLCVKDITWENKEMSPTCLASIPSHNNLNSPHSACLLASSFNNGSIFIYDIESSTFSQPILKLENNSNSETCRINSIAIHPTLSILVSAHEDKQIKFWDLISGKCIYDMIAHLDEVTCIACDPNGLHLLSGSHDCSVRLWNFDNRTCVQEITSHRKKFDEAIFDVTFHPTKPYFASTGADALAKVFV